MPNLYLFNNDGGRKGVIHALGRDYITRFRTLLRYFVRVFIIIGILAGLVWSLSDLFIADGPGYDIQGIISRFTASADEADDYDRVVVETDEVYYATASSYAADSAAIPGNWTTEFVYDGTAKNVAYDNLPYGVVVDSITGDGEIDAGEYPVTVTLKGGEYDGKTYELTLAIKKQINNVELHDAEVVYNGATHTLSVVGTVPHDVTVSYSYYKGASVADVKDSNKVEAAIDAGSYVVHAHASGDNYFNVDLYAVLVISPAEIDISALELKSESFVFDGNSHGLELVGDLPDGVTVSYKNNNKVNAGTYTVTATLNGGNNYVTKVFGSATLTITKATIGDLNWSTTEFVYNGFGWDTALCLVVGDSAIKAKVQYPRITNVPVSANVVYYIGGTPVANLADATAGVGVDAGNYVVKAVVSGSNYENTVEITADYVINKFKLEEYNPETGKGHCLVSSPVTNYDGTYKKVYGQFFIHKVSDGIHTAGNYDGIDISYDYTERLIPGTHDVTVTFSGANYETLEIKSTLTIDKGIIYIPDIDVDGDGIIDVDAALPYTFTYNGQVFALDEYDIMAWYATGIFDGVNIDTSACNATDAGEYDFQVVLSKQYYYDNYIDVHFNVKKGKFYIDEANSKDFGFKSLYGELLHPIIATKSTVNGEKIASAIPDANGIKYLLDGKEVDGVNILGTYKFKVILSNANRESEVIVSYWLLPNPIWLLIGMIAGIIIGILIAIASFIRRRHRERVSAALFDDDTDINMRNLITEQRNGIVCECYSKTRDNNGKMIIGDRRYKKLGRLYLTNKALEFYAEDFTNNYRNFVVRLDDVLSVEHGGVLNNIVIVCSKSRIQKFKVPAGTASAWSKEILHFKTLSQGRYLV